MDSYIFSFLNNKTWKMIFTVNVFADSVCVVFASPLTLLFALLCEHVSKTLKCCRMFADNLRFSARQHTNMGIPNDLIYIATASVNV